MIVWALRLPPELESWATGAGPECGAILGSWLSTPHLMFHFAVCRPLQTPLIMNYVIDHYATNHIKSCQDNHIKTHQAVQNPQLSGLASEAPRHFEERREFAAMGKEKDKMPEVDQWGSLAAPKMAKHGTHPQHKLENQLVAPRGSLLRHLRPRWQLFEVIGTLPRLRDLCGVSCPCSPQRLLFWHRSWSTHHSGSLKFFPVLLIGIFLPRLIGGAIAVAIFQKGNTALYNENMESLAKAATESICAAGPSQWIV